MMLGCPHSSRSILDDTLAFYDSIFFVGVSALFAALGSVFVILSIIHHAQ